MKLLIVDDQLVTLNGVAEGIKWSEEGFDVIDKAQNAMEARLSFSRGAPDVMLCDIEMPVEDGVEFCKWVRHQGYTTEIIFLTCHTEFEYAKEAIQLKVADYIVQPAAYSEIRNKVHNVVQHINEEKEKEVLQELGSEYSKEQDMVDSNIWHGYLNGSIGREGLLKLPNMPSPNVKAWLILQQLNHWRRPDAQPDTDFLISSLQNFLKEVFEKDSKCILSTFMEHNTYAIMIQPQNGISSETIISRLKYLSDCYDMYMPCSCVFFLSQESEIGDMPMLWRRMLQYRDWSPYDISGVQYLPEVRFNVSDSFHYVSQRQSWIKIYQSKDAFEMGKNAIAILEKYREDGLLNRKLLSSFQLDWLETIDELGTSTSIFETPEGSELLHKSLYSMDDMIAFLNYCVELFNFSDDDENVVKTIEEYVRENVYSNIRKEDISQLVHLNSDYITRLFKKETGYSVKAYIIHEKMIVARQLLQTTSLSVGSVAMQLGYNNFSYFSAAYKKEFGITPGKEKRPEI